MQSESWRSLHFGDCVKLLSGGTPSKGNSDYWGQDIPWVSCKDMKVDHLNGSEDWLSTLGAEKVRKVPAGTVLIVVRGMILAREFPVAWCQRDVTFNQDLKAVIPNVGVDARFIFCWLRGNTHEILGRVDEAGHGTKRLQTDRLMTVPLKLPPLPTQRRIASILSAYDDLIENNTKRIEILEEMARSLFLEVTREADTHCVEMSLGEIADADGGTIRTGPFGSQLHKHDYTEVGTPVIMPKDIIGGKLDDKSVARIPPNIVERLSQHALREGDIVYGRRGDIGRRAYIASEHVGWICGTGCLRISLRGHVLNSLYLQEYLGQRHIVELIAGRAVGSTMPNLNTKILRSIPIKVPSRELQEKYACSVTPTSALRNILVLKNKVLRQTRDLLLPKLISGELDVDALDLPEAS